MAVYVRLDDVDAETLSVVGFVLIDENEAYWVYRYLGEDVVVDKADPFAYVDDINDAAILGSELVPVPPNSQCDDGH